MTFECKTSARILSVANKYSMCELICGIINNGASSLDMGKISVYDNILVKTWKKRKDENKKINLCMNFILKDNLEVELLAC